MDFLSESTDILRLSFLVMMMLAMWSFVERLGRLTPSFSSFVSLFCSEHSSVAKVTHVAAKVVGATLLDEQLIL